MADYLRKNDIARVLASGRIVRVDDHGGLNDRNRVLVRFDSGVSLWLRWNELEAV